MTFKKVINGNPESLRLLSRRDCLRRCRGICRRYGGAPHKCRVLNHIQLGVLLIEIRLPATRDLVLLACRLIAILVIKHLDDFHAGGVYHREGRETLAIKERIVLETDENLRGARVGRVGLGIGYIPTLVALFHWVIVDIGIAPSRGNRGVRADAELHDESGHGTEDDHVVVEMMFDEVVETVRANRCPGPGNSHCEIAAGGLELDLKSLWRFLLKQCWAKQRAVISACRHRSCLRSGSDLRCRGRLGMRGSLCRRLRR